MVDLFDIQDLSLSQLNPRILTYYCYFFNFSTARQFCCTSTSLSQLKAKLRSISISFENSAFNINSDSVALHHSTGYIPCGGIWYSPRRHQ